MRNADAATPDATAGTSTARSEHPRMSNEPLPHYSSYPERIDIDDDIALRRWANRLSCSPSELKAAVTAVGDDPSTVAAFLRNIDGRPLPAREG